MFQLEKMPLVWFLLNILKSNFATYDWFWADESPIVFFICHDLEICQSDFSLSLSYFSLLISAAL